jgi:hypothetical protein
VSLGNGTEIALLDALFRATDFDSIEEGRDVWVAGVSEEGSDVIVQGVFVLGEPVLGGIFYFGGVVR